MAAMTKRWAKNHRINQRKQNEAEGLEVEYKDAADAAVMSIDGANEEAQT